MKVVWDAPPAPLTNYGWLGAVGGAETATSGNTSIRKDLTAFEKIMLAGLFLQVVTLSWQVYSWKEGKS